MAVEKGLRPQEEPNIKRHLIDINATPELESEQPLRNEKSMHYLSLVKPQMMQQVLSFRGYREEGKAASVSNHSQTKRRGGGQSMELFPQHPGFATTKSTNTRESAHKLQGRSLPSGSGFGGVQSPASRSPSPARIPPKQSSTQVTIFYNGTVNAYDVPADKAQAIMNMLTRNGNAHLLDSDPNSEKLGSYTATSGSSGSPPIWESAPPNKQKELSIALPIPTQLATAQIIEEIENLQGADLPLSRKQSLQRFLEKRKTRLKSAAPYTKVA